MQFHLSYQHGTTLLEAIIACSISVCLYGILYTAGASHLQTRQYVTERLLLAEHTLLLHGFLHNMIQQYHVTSSQQTLYYHSPTPGSGGSIYIDPAQCALYEKPNHSARAQKRFSHICQWSMTTDHQDLCITAHLCTRLGTCITPQLHFHHA